MSTRFLILCVAAIVVYGLLASVGHSDDPNVAPAQAASKTDAPPPVSHNDASLDWEDRDTCTIYRDINYFVLSGNSLTVPKEQGVLKNDINWREEPPWETLITSLMSGPNTMPQYGFSTLYADGSFIYTPYQWVFDDPGFEGLQDSFP